MNEIEEIQDLLNKEKILFDEKNAEYNELLLTIRDLEDEISKSKDVVENNKRKNRLKYYIAVNILILLEVLFPQIAAIICFVGLPIIGAVYGTAQSKNSQIIPDLQKKLNAAKCEQVYLFDIVNGLRSLVHGLEEELEKAKSSVDLTALELENKSVDLEVSKLEGEITQVESTVEYDNGQNLFLGFKSC